MTGGTETGYRKVLAQFSKDASERLNLFREFLPEPESPGHDRTGSGGDLSAFSTQVHAIKSAAGTIGATELSAEAAALEAAGKAGDLETIRKALPGFCDGLTELVEGIGKALAEADETGDLKAGSGAGSGAVSGAENGVSELLAALRSALEAKNMKEIDRLLEGIEGLSLDAGTREQINAVSDKVLMGEYEGALERVKALLGREQ
jgi:HPt (histidine-containing phosphotransfer) domain-containing protein